MPLMLQLSRFSTHINATELTPELGIPLEIVGLSGITVLRVAFLDAPVALNKTTHSVSYT